VPAGKKVASRQPPAAMPVFPWLWSPWTCPMTTPSRGTLEGYLCTGKIPARESVSQSSGWPAWLSQSCPGVSGASCLLIHPFRISPSYVSDSQPPCPYSSFLCPSHTYARKSPAHLILSGNLFLCFTLVSGKSWRLLRRFKNF
jgi:hypothetical protein